MRKLLLIVLVSSWVIQLFAAQKLSPTAQISLLTYDPIEDLYGSYGHSAIRVSDRINGIDYVYNYGTFDFDTPGFYVKFVRGQLNYKLSVVKNMRMFLYVNRELGKTIQEEVFLFTQEEKQKFFDLLEENAKPENAYYLYDFFFDNCSSRLRDLLVKTAGDSLRLSGDYFDKELSFRELQKLYLDGKQWTSFGIDFILGAKSDRIATPEERMYLPFELQKAFQKARIVRDGEEKPVLAPPVDLVKSAPLVLEDNPWTSPLVVFWTLFALIFGYTVWTFSKEKNHRWLDHIWFIIAGLGGLFVFLMWFGTDHSVTVNNWNLLWLHPFHLVVGIALFFKKARNSWLKRCFQVIFALTALTLAGWLLIPQEFNIGFMPIMLIILVRSYYQIKKL